MKKLPKIKDFNRFKRIIISIKALATDH
jgi:hypothetical protein